MLNKLCKANKVKYRKASVYTSTQLNIIFMGNTKKKIYVY